MMRKSRLVLVLSALAGGMVTGGPVGRAEENKSAPVEAVRIGLVSSLFRDTPETLITAMMQPFGALMESQTGLSGKLISGGNAVNLGKLLAEDKIHLGVFHGVEFAWARQQNPGLRPLMIAVNQKRHLHALVVVRADATAADFTDLKGQALAQPQKSREHCRLFLNRRCQATGLEAPDFFGKIATPSNNEDALDDVVDKLVHAAVVDGIALECYQRRKPARFAQLKVLERSEVFPAAVVAYHPGALNDATLQRFREGMLNANKGALGRQFMALWKLTAFEAIPDDYEQTLAQILKTYPVPDCPAAR
jgi:ABC-type phosphate/phosphonate transport system substrate-binding protein